MGRDREAGAGVLLPREEPKSFAAVSFLPSKSINSLPDYFQIVHKLGFLGITNSQSPPSFSLQESLVSLLSLQSLVSRKGASRMWWCI